MVLLFGAVPGGPELLVILLVLALLFGIPLALLVLFGVGGVKLLGTNDDAGDAAGDDDRLAELERELAETRAELRELREQQRRDGSESDEADADDYDESRSS